MVNTTTRLLQGDLGGVQSKKTSLKEGDQMEEKAPTVES